MTDGCHLPGRPPETPPFDANDPNADLRASSAKATADTLAFYARARAAHRRQKPASTALHEYRASVCKTRTRLVQCGQGILTPLTDADLERKFLSCAEMALRPAQARSILALLESVAELGDIAQLTTALGQLIPTPSASRTSAPLG